MTGMTADARAAVQRLRYIPIQICQAWCTPPNPIFM